MSLDAGVVEDHHLHAFFESAQLVAARAPGLRVHLDLGRLRRHRVADRRLCRRRRDVHDRDGVAAAERAAEGRRALEGSGRIGRDVALAIGKNRRDVLAERPELVVAGVGAGAGHQQVFLQGVDRNAQPLLHVGDFRLGSEHPMRGIHERECRPGHRHHDDGGNQHLGDREARLRSPRALATSIGAASRDA